MATQAWQRSWVGGLLLALACAAAPAHAASGRIERLVPSALTVQPGAWINLRADYGVLSRLWDAAGADPVEPMPEPGTQTWLRSWSTLESETLTGVWLATDGQRQSVQPVLSPGDSMAGSFTFALRLHRPGVHTLSVEGGWSSRFELAVERETATRTCDLVDAESGAVACGSWAPDTFRQREVFDNEGRFRPASITVEVVAVPEPPALVLAASGLLMLGAWRRRLSAQPARRSTARICSP